MAKTASIEARFRTSITRRATTRLSMERSSPYAGSGTQASPCAASVLPPILRLIGGTDSPLNRSHVVAFWSKQPSPTVIFTRSVILTYWIHQTSGTELVDRNFLVH